ncbi:MAG: efflux RND transporter periplasmic adaptor subunit, partial [Thermodesulfobacteriota bacterium]
MRVLKILLILIFLNCSLVYGQNKPPVKVVTSKIVFQNVAHNRSFIGTLYYERISHLSSEVPGLVTKINVRTGDKVDQSSSLIYLDRQILEKEILLNQTRIEQAKLNINHMQKKYNRVASLF